MFTLRCCLLHTEMYCNSTSKQKRIPQKLSGDFLVINMMSFFLYTFIHQFSFTHSIQSHGKKKPNLKVLLEENLM